MNALFRKVAIGATLATAALVPSPASATTEVGSATGCANGPLTPAADFCAGYFSNNQFSGNSTDVAAQQNAINLLLGAGNYTVNWTSLINAGQVVSGSDLNALNNLLAGAGGQVLLGLHWGNVPGAAGNVSAFYLWNDVTPGSIHLTDTQGYSNAVLYRATAAVPEPATWALMLLGFGGMGVSMRRRRSVNALPQMA